MGTSNIETPDSQIQIKPRLLFRLGTNCHCLNRERTGKMTRCVQNFRHRFPLTSETPLLVTYLDTLFFSIRTLLFPSSISSPVLPRLFSLIPLFPLLAPIYFGLPCDGRRS
jgi:hypothetical protein